MIKVVTITKTTKYTVQSVSWDTQSLSWSKIFSLLWENSHQPDFNLSAKRKQNKINKLRVYLTIVSELHKQLECNMWYMYVTGTMKLFAQKKVSLKKLTARKGSNRCHATRKHKHATQLQRDTSPQVARGSPVPRPYQFVSLCALCHVARTELANGTIISYELLRNTNARNGTALPLKTNTQCTDERSWELGGRTLTQLLVSPIKCQSQPWKACDLHPHRACYWALQWWHTKSHVSVTPLWSLMFKPVFILHYYFHS